ncbi:hypothetical protein ACH5RR_024533 [Cinchona calisaya]|uniref:F-box domain-containing protein n=1 Tax=Cinchona calisaya TaxID=153742 RepID=A0ABD2YXX2_9GENT
MELFPGLPDDIGLECLVRVPYDHFSSAASVCKSWKLEIQLPEFIRQRKVAGFARRVIVMAQARVDQARKSGSGKFSATPVYRLTLCEPETGYWTELPPVPGYADGLPMFCQLIGAGLNLVVMGGWNRVTWEVSNAVFVYSFVSGTWRRGADMPGCRRSFFACASDSDRTVFVAGGHDGEKNALRSAWAYDVAKGEWVPLPDMAKERDESKGTFHGGKFHVIGGYHTNMQGRFSTSAESFDIATWRWDPVQDGFLDVATCPRTCVDGTAGNGRLLMCRDVDVVGLENSEWQVVTQIPSDVRNISYVTAWQGKLLLIGSPRFSEPHRVYTLNLKSCLWTKVETPESFSGHVQSGCCLEM